jgi:hypothetical protein
MLNRGLDPSIRETINRLIKEELRLLARRTLGDSERLRIEEIRAALDRCFNALKPRHA